MNETGGMPGAPPETELEQRPHMRHMEWYLQASPEEHEAMHELLSHMLFSKWAKQMRDDGEIGPEPPAWIEFYFHIIRMLSVNWWEGLTILGGSAVLFLIVGYMVGRLTAG